MDRVLVRHRDPDLQCHLVELGHGAVGAAGAPAKGRLSAWRELGVTDVVTLQRSDEMADWLPAAVQDNGMAWHHRPLSGRRLERASDRESLARIADMAALLEEDPPRWLVIHCAAGLHRTGVALYLVARASGRDADQTVALLGRCRPITARELTRRPRRRESLIEVAEAAFEAWARR